MCVYIVSIDIVYSVHLHVCTMYMCVHCVCVYKLVCVYYVYICVYIVDMYSVCVCIECVCVYKCVCPVYMCAQCVCSSGLE